MRFLFQLEHLLKAGLFGVGLMLTTFPVQGQNGYVRLIGHNASRVGYIKPYSSVSGGLPGLEVWSHKGDTSPDKIPVTSIAEYAIKKDTFIVLQHFKPFADLDISYVWVEAQLIEGGKINLYKIGNSKYPAGVGLIPKLIYEFTAEFNYPYIYLLNERNSAEIPEALPSKVDQLMDKLLTFYSGDFLTSYSRRRGEITYQNIPHVVRSYNRK